MKRCVALLLGICMLFGGCALSLNSAPKQFTVTYLNLFDTVTTVISAEGTEEAFQQNAQVIYEELLIYHKLLDIYNDYEGIANLKTVNDQAGVAPVTVDPVIIRFLQCCKDYYALTGGKVNVAMGSVLRLWHEARTQSLEDPENAAIPDADALSLAVQHTDMDCVILDEAASTVYLSDPEMSLDVGAIAKGWAAQQVAEKAPAGMLISIGGNVCATGPKYADGTPWVVGIQDPDNSGSYLRTLQVSGGAVVTSGDYQRFFTVAGKTYHHIIDPQTQMPAGYWRSVTVICADSALADALSTALFLLPLAEGRELAEQCGVQALWLDGAGNEFMTNGLPIS